MNGTNGEKKILWWLVTLFITIILGLVTTLWATQQAQISKNCESIEDIKDFVSRQDEINKVMNEKLTQIYDEVKQ